MASLRGIASAESLPWNRCSGQRVSTTVYKVIVIGAGQAGLSAAYRLKRKGLVPEVDFLILDANPAPGGAWLHRWDSLTLGSAHHIHDLPDFPLNRQDGTPPASTVVSDYYRQFEEVNQLHVHRPERVLTLRSDHGDTGPLTVVTDQHEYLTRLVISGTGTWDKPHWPTYPGVSNFPGRQLHTKDFTDASDFTGKRVLVVGGGTSAVQFLLQLHDAGATTFWSTRRPPQFTQRAVDQEWGRAVERAANEQTKNGLTSLSVVALTGIPDTPAYRAGRENGVLVSRGPISQFTGDRVHFSDGSSESVEVILWATGFRPSLDHLTPLKLRESGGGIAVDGVRVLKEPRLFLVGFGASASTLGATRVGRQAAVAATQALRADPVPAG